MAVHTNAAVLGGEAPNHRAGAGGWFSWAVLRGGLWQHQDGIIGMEEAEGTWHRIRINLDPLGSRELLSPLFPLFDIVV